jgi:hypothetical protein
MGLLPVPRAAVGRAKPGHSLAEIVNGTHAEKRR